MQYAPDEVRMQAGFKRQLMLASDMAVCSHVDCIAAGLHGGPGGLCQTAATNHRHGKCFMRGSRTQFRLLSCMCFVLKPLQSG